MVDNPTKSGTPSKSKPRAFGIEPGTLRGNSLQYSGPPPIDPEEELISRVDKMSGPEMRSWLKQDPQNRERLNQAHARRGRT